MHTHTHSHPHPHPHPHPHAHAHAHATPAPRPHARACTRAMTGGGHPVIMTLASAGPPHRYTTTRFFCLCPPAVPCTHSINTQGMPFVFSCLAGSLQG
jgi:hypothetical protein